MAAVVIASLGIGIGVNTTVFSWIQARTLQPLAGVPSGGSFYLVEPRTDSGIYPGASWLEFRDLRDRMPAFADLIAFRMAPFSVGDAAWSERTFGLLVSSNYFTALGLTPALGRFFSIDDAPIAGGAGEPVAVVSHAFWQARLGGGPDAIGRTLRVNNRTFTVVGIARPDFRGTLMGVSFDLWIPATFAPAVQSGSRELETRGQRGYSLIGRLKPGVSTDVAQSELEAAMADFAREYPDISRSMRADVLPIWRAPRGPQRMLLGALAVLQGLMFIVLLTVCGNTANLLLARASARRQEVAVRLALGGGRVRIVSLLLTESLVLAGAGTALGVALAVWGTDALRAVPMPTPAGVSFRFESAVDVVTVAFAAGLGLLSGVLFGLAPAWQLARLDAQPALRLGVSPAGRSRVRDALMFVEVALAIVVLIVAARFVRSFNETQSTDPGFQKDGVVLAAYDLATRARGIDPESSRAFAARLLARTRELPGVEAAALATSVPLDIHGMGTRFFTLEGRARDDGRPDQARGQHRLRRLLPHDGHRASRRDGLRRARRHRRACPGDRERIVHAAVSARRRARRPLGRGCRTPLHDRRRRRRFAVERVRRGIDARAVFLVSRSPVGGCRASRPHAARRRNGHRRRCPPRAARHRSDASALQRPHPQPARRDEPDLPADSGAHFRRPRPVAPGPCRHRHLRRRVVRGRAAARRGGPAHGPRRDLGSCGPADRRRDVESGRGWRRRRVGAGARHRSSTWPSSVPIDIQAFAAVPVLLLVVAVGAATWPALRAGRVRPVVALKETGN